MTPRTRPWHAFAMALTFFSLPATVPAATIFVDGNAVAIADDGLCSLREAIHNAVADAQVDNTDCVAGSGDDTIELAGDEIYLLTDADAGNPENGLPVLTTSIGFPPETLTIDGNDSAIERVGTCTLDGTRDASEFRIFEIDEGVVELRDLTLSNGCADGVGDSGRGGAIRVFRGALSLERVVIEGNLAQVESGGLHVDESGVQVEESTFADNSANGDAGAIGSTDGQLMIVRSTISGNTSGGSGGGLATAGSAPETQTTLRYSTVSGNTATLEGGGLKNTGEMQVDASTVTDNAAGAPSGGGGIRNTGFVTLNNSIVAGNGAGGDCANLGTFAAAGTNLDSDGTCAAAAGTVTTVTLDDLALQPLADYGGLTETHDLAFGSVAIDAVIDCNDTAGDPPTTDQRGVDRPQDGDGDGTARCDVGAVEAPEVIIVDDACTLGDAIEAANLDQTTVGGCVDEASGPDTLVLDVDTVLTAADTVRSTLFFGSFAGTPDITSTITIRAGQASVIERDESLDCDVPDGPDEFRLLQVFPSADAGLELAGVTLRGGCADTGGAVLGSRVDITDSTFLDNTAISTGDAQGGAVFVGEGRANITGSHFQGNRALGADAYGGAVALESTDHITNSRFVGNVVEAAGEAYGGALWVSDYAVQLRDLVFEANAARAGFSAQGGGPWIDAVDSLRQVLLRENQALGDSVLAGPDNAGWVLGGGAYVRNVTSADGITLVDNLAQGGDADSGAAGYVGGGGLYLAGEGTLRNLTASGNTARGGQSNSGPGGSAFGGGVQFDGDFRLENSTVALNEAIAGLGGGGDGMATGGGIYASEAITVGSSLLEQNTTDVGGSVAASDCGEFPDYVTSLGYNAVGAPATCDFSATGDQTGVAPALLPLGNHGCASTLPDGSCLPSHPVALGSDAIDTGSCTASGITTDLREFLRPIDFAGVADADDGCDVGAYESRDLDEGVGDGVEDGVDNCPEDVNPGQEDGDGDGFGDACDLCFGNNQTGDGDGDGVCANLDCDDGDPTNACGPIFSDGFESGDTSAWSATVP